MGAVIKVENLSKQYRLGDVGTGSLKDDFKRFRYRLMGKEDPFLQVGELNNRTTKSNSDYVWALKDINFDIEQGDVVGIIGRNGAGKSTLLKILSRTTAPTTGSVKVKGRIASLLEVGTGFHGELSGRENIYLNGAIMGLRKWEIDKKLDEIIDFAGVEKYLDTPVKRYSSGMYVRLAFAVAAHLEPDILIVDEVLAVGDAEFQKKCMGKMKDVSGKEGRTILFVSHILESVKNLCNSGMLLENGLIKIKSKIKDVLQEYGNVKDSQKDNKWNSSVEKNLPFFKNLEVKIVDESETLFFFLKGDIVSLFRAKPCFVAFDIKNSSGLTIMQAIPCYTPFLLFEKNYNKISFECKINIDGLIPDIYYISPWIGSSNIETYDFQIDIVSIEKVYSNQKNRTFTFNSDHGFYNPKSEITIV